MDNSLSLA